MSGPAAVGVISDAGDYTISIADTPDQVRAVQRLRYRVFAEEMGALLRTPVPDHDVDPLDEIADHLIVTDTASGEAVGTYRLLPTGRTDRLYSDGEFDLSALADLRPRLVEAGRSCVHPDHRSGTVITLLWAGLARYMLLSGHRHLAGCASVPLDDGGRTAAGTCVLAAGTRYAAPPEYRVVPRRPWQPMDLLPKTGLGHQPPLLRGYLRLGAWICGPPAYDPDFGVADFFVLLAVDRVSDRHRRYFLKERR